MSKRVRPSVPNFQEQPAVPSFEDIQIEQKPRFGQKLQAPKIPQQKIETKSPQLKTLDMFAKIQQKYSKINDKKETKDHELEYDPARPNNFMQIKKQKEFQEKMKFSQKERVEQKEQQELQVNGSLQKAFKMMQRQGFQIDKGLGKNNQGIKNALILQQDSYNQGQVVQSDLDISSLLPEQIALKEWFQQYNIKPSQILMLTNIILQNELYQDFQQDIRNEAINYGNVQEIKIHLNQNQEDQKKVRVFIKFLTEFQAMKGYQGLNGRSFGDLNVHAYFYDEKNYQNNNFDI